jgi:hypothetical protein
MTEEDKDIVARVGAFVREERAAEPEPEAAKPLDDAAVDRIVAKVTPAANAAKNAAKKEAPAAKVLAFPRWARIYGAPIAVAAAVVLFIATRDHGSDGPVLPGYAITASGEQALRGDAPKTTTLRIGKGAASKFEIVLRPDTSVGEAKIVAYAFVMEEGDVAPLDAKVEISKEGSVRITGDARALGTSKEARIVLATPESAGGYVAAADRAKSGRGDDHVKVLAVTIERE